MMGCWRLYRRWTRVDDRSQLLRRRIVDDPRSFLPASAFHNPSVRTADEMSSTGFVPALPIWMSLTDLILLVGTVFAGRVVVWR
jgi:hypothetical protein